MHISKAEVAMRLAPGDVLMPRLDRLASSRQDLSNSWTGASEGKDEAKEGQLCPIWPEGLSMRLMLVFLAIVVLLIIDFSRYNGHYSNQIAHTVEQGLKKLGW
jgi:hypothetical protein